MPKIYGTIHGYFMGSFQGRTYGAIHSSVGYPKTVLYVAEEDGGFFSGARSRRGFTGSKHQKLGENEDLTS